MKTKHNFVPALDVGELMPFRIKTYSKLADQIKEQERSKKELEKFIKNLEDRFGEDIWYLGTDIIGERYYERFMFNNGGFLEIMMESPVAITAHFVKEQRAKKFAGALKNTLKHMLPSSIIVDMFIDSIVLQSTKDENLTVHKWHTMKGIRR